MRLEIPRRRRVELPLMPLVDVVFLLLLFFMVTSRAQALPVKLFEPPQAREVTQGSAASHRIAIDHNEELYYDGQKMSMRDIEHCLARDRPDTLVLHTDRHVTTGVFMALYDLCQIYEVNTIQVSVKYRD